ncbi:MAG TPA: hypothetical protein VMY42_19820 [Thermoguttaceae bacterium]|nr:hypothetical protein [Thermoguttaceae bacterium]
MKTVVLGALLLLAGLSASAQESFGEDLAHGRLATTGTLPIALATIEPNPEDILTAHEAQSIRGRWILSLNFPLVATAIQGRGSFDLNLLTLSGGVAAGMPVHVRIHIGR